MADLALLDCIQPSITLERVNFFPRQILTADDMIADQDYFRQKLRRHNRFLHGWGVVCGLEVTPDQTKGAPPWQVQIGAGYALGPYGDEIYVAEPVFLDLARCGPDAVTDPCEPDLLPNSGSVGGQQLFIAIKYAECVARPVRVMPAGCACEQVACEYSRIRDSFEIGCLTNLNLPTPPPPPPLCEFIHRPLLPCLSCPTDPWVLLAQVTLPRSRETQIVADNIDSYVRRLVFSTAMLQGWLIECCCDKKPPPPPPPPKRMPAKVTSITPRDKSEFTSTQGQPDTTPSAVVITFDKHLQPGTVNISTIQVTIGKGDGQGGKGPPSSVPGTVSYDDGAMSAIFTPSNRFSSSLAGDFYEVTVRGTGSNPIRDLDSLALDGAGTGSPGSDKTSSFVIWFRER